MPGFGPKLRSGATLIRKASAVVVALVVGLSTSTTVLAKPSQLPASPGSVTVATVVTPNGSWTTYHHDNAHTGNDPAAPAVGSVAPTPGWTETTLDGEVYAEPLIYNGLVYVATLNNSVYALNQTDGTQVWRINLGAPVTTGWSCGNVSPQGILGTPVIDTTGGRIYVTTLFASDHTYRVFGLDLATGAVMLQTAIPASIGTGFDWTIHQQRGALAVANSYVYVPFGGRFGDCGVYHGWVVGVPTNGSANLVVYETPGSGNGFWAAGGVVVDDATGNVFETSGNGNVSNGCSANADGSPQFENDAVVRLSPTLVHQDFFMPQDWQANWCSNDEDLGSASPVLISPSLLFQAGKWGGGFLLNPNNLGGMDGQRFPTPKPAPYSQAEVCLGNHSYATFGSFAYAAPFIYVECDFRGLVALNTNTATPAFSPCDATCAAPDWHAGGSVVFGPPIVAGGAVWVTDSNGSGLYAFNAATGAQIYQSASFGTNHFVTPAEAGGQVFVPSHTVIKSFTFAPPPPTVGSVAPNSGPTAGGTSVTITGTNFTGATAVKFGTAPAATFTVISTTQIAATSPPGSGTVDVTVTTAGGMSATSAADQFSYTAPWVATYSVGGTPTSWAISQTQTYSVTITNTGSQTWPAGGGTPVHLAVHFANVGGGAGNNTWYTDQRFSLPADLAAGGSVTLSIAVTAPANSGSLVLEYQMVKETQFWFRQFADVSVTAP
jgi:polyvinyl alcohol dehydrogenase (cytochrome)